MIKTCFRKETGMNQFRSFKIGVKMLAGYFAVAAITAVLGFISTLSLHDLLTAAQSTYTDSTEPLGSMGRIGIVVQRSRVNIRGMLLDDSVERMEANAATIRKNDSIIDQDMSHLEKSLKQDLRKDFTKLQKLLVEYRPVREKIISLALSGEREEALDLMRSDGLAFEKDIDATIGTLLDLEVKQAKENLEQNDAAAWMSIKLNILLVLIGVVAAAVIGYFLARHITGPLRKVADFAEAIASGDLTDRLNLQRKDETGQLAAAMNVMADKLRSIITLLFQQSSSVAAAADRLTSTSSAMANGTEEVSSQSMTLAAASEEMAATSNEISSNCHMVADGARKARIGNNWLHRRQQHSCRDGADCIQGTGFSCHDYPAGGEFGKNRYHYWHHPGYRGPDQSACAQCRHRGCQGGGAGTWICGGG